MNNSKIEWTEKTWNPVVGCDKVSAGCKNCYAITMANRLMYMPHSKERYAGTVERTAGGQLNWTGKVSLVPKVLEEPLKIKKPTRFFVNSMSDLFHPDVPFNYVDKVFAVMAMCPQHTFQILTKRPERMVEYFNTTSWASVMTELDIRGEEGNLFDKATEAAAKLLSIRYLPNVWLGVSVENQDVANLRIPFLLQVPAAVRFLSIEPLLGPVDLGLMGTAPHTLSYGYAAIYQLLNWIIVGGESGHGARPMHPDWIRRLRDQCTTAGVPFFFKQWGEYRLYAEYFNFPGYADNVGRISRLIGSVASGKAALLNADNSDLVNGGPEHKVYPIAHMQRVGKREAGRLLDGREWNDMPY